MGSQCGIEPTTHRTMSGRSTTELHLAPAILQCPPASERSSMEAFCVYFLIWNLV